MVASLIIRPPKDAQAAGWRLVLGLTLLFGLAPASRVGYFVYPAGLAAWLLLAFVAGPAWGQDAFSCGPFKVEAKKTASGSQWTIARGGEKSSETAVLKSGPRFECVAGEAASGEEVLQKIENWMPDVVVMDMLMPGGMDGPELAAEARRLRPKLKVLYTSGYPRSEYAAKGVTAHQLLSKPYEAYELAAKLREILDGRSA